MRLLNAFWANKSGATSIEYALIATLISIGIIVGVTSLGSAVNSTFSYISTTALGDGKLGQ